MAERIKMYSIKSDLYINIVHTFNAIIFHNITEICGSSLVSTDKTISMLFIMVIWTI